MKEMKNTIKAIRRYKINKLFKKIKNDEELCR